MKNDVLQFAAQPSQIEEAYNSIQQGLSKLTQQLGINPWSWKNENFSHVFEVKSIPVAGEVVYIDNFEMIIESADERSIKKVKIRRVKSEGEKEKQ